MNRRVRIEIKVAARDQTGDPVETWTFVKTLWMGKRDVRANERFTADQVVGEIDTVFTARFNPAWIELSSDTHRLVYRGRIYNILGAIELGHRDGVEFACKARAGEAAPAAPADPPARTALDVLAETVARWEGDHASNVLVGASYSQITDLSGSGNTLTQLEPGRPGRVDSSGIISIEFRGSDSMGKNSITAALMNHANAGGTEFAVIRPDSAGGGGFGQIWSKNISPVGLGESMFVESIGSLLRINKRYSFEAAGSRGRTTTGLAFGQKYIVDTRLNKADGDADLIVGINGTSLTYVAGLESLVNESGAPRDNSGNDFPFSLGSNVFDENFDGGIYVLAFWNTVLSDEDLALVRNHFATKYGVTLA